MKTEKQGHTPGPWENTRTGGSPVVLREGHCIAVVGIRDSATRTAKKMGVYSTPEDRHEQKANAKLIAAAPDMLAALNHVLARLECVREKAREGDVLHTWFVQSDYGLFEAVQAAIAKATA